MIVRHQRLRVAVAVVAAAALTVAAGCGGGRASGGGSGASYLAAVTRAAYTTDQVPGYKFDITVTTKLGGKSATVTGSGTIGERGSQGSASLKIDGKVLTEIIDRPYMYIKVPDGATASHGKPWVRADPNVLSESFGGGSLGGSSADPTQILSFLRSAGTVTRVGSEDVHGAPATHYHALIDLQRLDAAVAAGQRAAARKYAETLKRISGTRTLPMDVWIDSRSRVSRISFTLSLCGPGGGRLQVSLNMELYGYGPQPAIAPPPASRFHDVSDALKSQIAKGVQQLSCH
jgi:hypothetical protein